MKVIIDGQPLLGNRTGIGRYTKSLIDQLLNEENIELVVLFNQIFNMNKSKSIRQEYKGRKLKFRNTRYPYKVIRRFLNKNLLYSYPIDLSFKKKKDLIFHATNFVTLPTLRAKNVVTIHDLAFMLYPETTSNKIYNHHMKWVPYSLKKVDHIIAVSQQTKNDLVNHLSVPESKISVIYNGVDDIFEKQSGERVEQVKKKYSLPNRYILFVGTLEPRKNLPTLVKSYFVAKSKYGLEEKLVVVGAKGWKYDPIFDTVKKMHLLDDIVFTGYVEDHDLPSIYSGASLFAFPSLYEGFGIPLVEAMRCEVPVIASNTSSIPEVVGDAGILVDPYNVEKWAEEIATIIYDKNIRERLVRKGIEQSKNYSWEKVAQQTLEVYRKVLDQEADISTDKNFSLPI